MRVNNSRILSVGAYKQTVRPNSPFDLKGTSKTTPPTVDRRGNSYPGNEHTADFGQHDQSLRYVVSVSTDDYPLPIRRPLDGGPNHLGSA